MWRICREANRPWPVICEEDPVVDYMVMEAVALKVRKLDEDARKEAERHAKASQARKDLVREFA